MPDGIRTFTLIFFIFILLSTGIPAISATVAPRGAESVAIGCILPLSGRNASYGNRALDTILFASGVFNAAKQTRIRILIEDSQSEPAIAGAAVGKLAGAGVVCILGPLGSQEAQEAAIEAQRLKVPILTLTQREGITGIGDYVFRNFLTAATQVRTLVEYARIALGLLRFAILYPDDPYGHEMARLFREEVRLKGGELRKERSYKTDQTDFGEEIRVIGGVEPLSAGTGGVMQPSQKPTPGFDALFIPDSSNRVAMIIPQLAYYGLTGIRLLGTSGWNSSDLLKGDPGHLQGAIFVDGFFTDSFKPEVNDFIETFYKANGREPDAMDALVYDTTGIAVKLMTDSSGATREAFRKALSQLRDYPGVTGKTSFPPTRDAEKDLFILTVRDGQIIEVK
jgi:branched-chain amino acid transport system substrate-binding protein